MNIWQADPHQFGPGKAHIVDSKDEARTFCGRALAAIPGKSSPSGKATCRTCLDLVVRRPERERESELRRKQYEAEERAKAHQRAQERVQYRAWYHQYLNSAEWKVRRAKVLKRAGGVCEGCVDRPATEVHHTTYEHIGNEFLWELRAICRPCHERVTALDEDAKR